MTGIPTLTTKRLTIRRAAESDFDAIHELSARGWGDGSNIKSEEAREESRQGLEWNLLNDLFPRLRWWNDRLITLTDTQKVIGSIALVPMPLPLDAVINGSDSDMGQVAEISMIWVLLPEYRGSGYATEAAGALVDFAFKQFKLKRIIADTERENKASQGVMRRLGMTLYENKSVKLDWLEIIGVLNNPEMGTGQS